MSEGRRRDVIDVLARAAGAELLDVHSDAHHNRSVLTLAGPGVSESARALARAAVEHIDLRDHDGVHPRFGAVDVVPFVPLLGAPMAEGVAARDEFADWIDRTLAVPALRYGSGEVELPDLRRHARAVRPHPTAGVCAVGARSVLVAYNLWLAEPDFAVARSIARDIRGPDVRALAFAVGEHVQVSLNLVAPERFGPAAAFDAVATRTGVARAELVGLAPASVVDAVPPARWPELDLDPSRTIEARLQEAGLVGGSGEGKLEGGARSGS